MSDASDIYRGPVPDPEASRLSRESPRWCAICIKWGNHHTDRCKEDELASPADVESNLAEARSRIGRETS